MKNFRLSVKKNAVALIHEERLLGELLYRLQVGKTVLRPTQVTRIGENAVSVSFPLGRVSDAIVVKDQCISIKRTWRIEKAGKYRLFFTYRVLDPSLKNWVIPSVMYHENRHGLGKFPRGGLEVGWSFREDRIPVPSCAILHSKNAFQSIFTSPAKGEGDLSSVKSWMVDTHPILEIAVPFVEEPFAYTEKGIFSGGLTRRRGEYFHVTNRSLPFSYQRDFFIAVDSALDHSVFAFQTITRTVLHEAPAKKTRGEKVDWSDVARLKLRHLDFLLIRDTRKRILGLKMGKGNGLIQRYYEYLMASFLGKNIEAATVFARLAGELKSEAMYDTAERIARFFLGGAMSNGLYRDMYDLRKKRWNSYCGPHPSDQLLNGANSRSNGEAMLHYIRLFRHLKRAGRDVPEIVPLVKANAEFFLDHQLEGDEEGSYGRWWNERGEPVNTLGTNGAYIISFLIEYEKCTGENQKIRDSLKRAANHYATLIEENAYYADSLDADCVDKEAGTSLLRAYLDLYEAYGDPEYLKPAKKAASFILSWMWLYNVTFPQGTPAARERVKTIGLTSVSVAHHHLDFYGLFIAFDYLRLWRATNEECWKEYAILLIDACGQLVATEENFLGRSKEYIGWQPEQLNQTRWDYIHRIRGTKGKFHFCDAWTVVLTLGAMLDIRERFPEILNFHAAV